MKHLTVPHFGCQNCYEDHSWRAEDLRLDKGAPICENCYDERRYAGDALPGWHELPAFAPAHEARLSQAERLAEALRETMDHIYIGDIEEADAVWRKSHAILTAWEAGEEQSNGRSD